LEWLDNAFTFVFIAGIMNSINMLDNMDGVSAVSTVPLWFIALLNGPMPFLGIMLLAAVLAFLWFNKPVAKIYMGDSGSMLLGMLLSVWLAALSTERAFGIPSEQGFSWVATTLLIMALPLADTTLVVFQRLRHGVSPATGGRDHSTHHWVYFGLTGNQVFILYAGLGVIQLLLYGFLTLWFQEPLTAFGSVICIVYFLTLLAVFLGISFRNLKKAKFHYP
jgi:UDP-GlcNAc:undecaprenyl-phosphate/decaprenyl-phosphate GlcNAc-1-phosphate transferase